MSKSCHKVKGNKISFLKYPLTCYDTGGEEGPESNQVAR